MIYINGKVISSFKVISVRDVDDVQEELCITSHGNYFAKRGTKYALLDNNGAMYLYELATQRFMGHKEAGLNFEEY